MKVEEHTVAGRRSADVEALRVELATAAFELTTFGAMKTSTHALTLYHHHCNL